MDCYCSYDRQVLVVGNERIERTWILLDGLLVPQGLLDKQSREQWFNEGAQEPVFTIPGVPSGNAVSAVTMEAFEDNDLGIARPHLKVIFTVTTVSVSMYLEIKIYPGSPFIRQEWWIKRASTMKQERAAAAGQGESSAERAGISPGVQLEDNVEHTAGPAADIIDFLPLKPLHCRWQTVQFRDVTDRNNNLVSRDSGLLYKNEHRWLSGNLLALNQSLQPAGLLVIKESPTASGHLHRPDGDFRFVGRNLTVAGSGLAESELSEDALPAYGVTVGVYDGTEYGMLRLLHEYHQAIRVFRPDQDAYVMSNTWGDRSRDDRISEAFILSELPVAAQLGVKVYQIDDGWQQGVTANSVVKGGSWGSYYDSRSDFWNVHKQRFPNGLDPVVHKAKELGLQLGLWFSPDSSNHFTYWERDADTLLYYYQLYDIRYFKLDGIKIRSKLGEQRLRLMMEKVVRSSGGRVSFNQDTTAEVRLGFFGKTQYGSLFLENRYTDWSNYYPHWTSRNLWQLASYISPSKLQVEFLNVYRNQDNYAGDPLAPAAVGIEYAFALTLFANPLAWMEVTGLHVQAVEGLQRINSAYKLHQQAILGGHIMPVGQEPDGTSWTGFQSITGSSEGYLLILREWSRSEEAVIKLWNTEDTRQLQFESIVASTGASGIAKISPTEGGTGIRCLLPFEHSFTLYKYMRK
jgi:hypothetical protein